MKHALWCLATLSLVGCWDFDGTYNDCVAEGRCGSNGADAAVADDAGTQDAGTEDAGPGDGGSDDAGTGDGGPPDAGDEDAGLTCATDGCTPGDWCKLFEGGKAFWKVRGAAGHVMAVGNGGAFAHFDGCQLHTDTRTAFDFARDVWLSEDAAVAWVVGQADAGTAVLKTWHRYQPSDGGWTEFNWHAGTAIHGVWGSAPDDLWSAGDGFESNAVYRSVGGDWTEFESRAGTSQRGIWGTSATDVWTVGRFGSAQHWDGAQWTLHELVLGAQDFEAVWGDAPDNYWAVGEDGGVAHWSGSEWVNRSLSTADRHWDVVGADGGAVWVAGAVGKLRRVAPNAAPVDETLPTFTQTRSVYQAPDGALWVVTSGGSLFVKLPAP